MGHKYQPTPRKGDVHKKAWGHELWIVNDDEYCGKLLVFEKDKTYDCTTYFSNHIKTKSHQKWLSDMNTNKSNFFLENISLKDTINKQKQIIGKLEKEVQIKLKTIDYLTQQMTIKDANYNTVNNLLDFSLTLDILGE